MCVKKKPVVVSTACSSNMRPTGKHIELHGHLVAFEEEAKSCQC